MSKETWHVYSRVSSLSLIKECVYEIMPNQYAVALYLTCCFCCCSQNPREADAMTKVQAELDETKIILVNNLHKLRPSILIEDEINAHSKIFFRWGK